MRPRKYMSPRFYKRKVNPVRRDWECEECDAREKALNRRSSIKPKRPKRRFDKDSQIAKYSFVTEEEARYEDAHERAVKHYYLMETTPRYIVIAEYNEMTIIDVKERRRYKVYSGSPNTDWTMGELMRLTDGAARDKAVEDRLKWHFGPNRYKSRSIQVYSPYDLRD